MSLATRLTALAQAIGADIKTLNTRLASTANTYGYTSGAGTSVSPANTWKTVPIAAPTVSEPAGAFTRNADGSVTVRDAGWYQVSATVHIATPNLYQLTIGTAPDAPGGICEDYSLQNIEQFGTPSGAVKLAAGAKLYVTVYSAATNIFIREFSIAGIGPQGPVGATGATGGNATVALDAWHTAGGAGENAPYSAAFGPASGIGQNVYFRKDPFGRVKIRGVAISKTAFGFGQVVLTLPATHRPTATPQDFEAIMTEPDGATNQVVQMRANIDGTIAVLSQVSAKVSGGSASGGIGTYIRLDGWEFDTDSVTQYMVGPKGDPGGVNVVETLDWNNALAPNFYRSTSDFLQQTIHGPGDQINPPRQAGIVASHANGTLSQKVWDLDLQVGYTRFKKGDGTWTPWVADLLPPPVLSGLIVGAPTPQEGDERYFQNAAMLAQGIIWKFRYNKNSSSTYKWEFVGGSKYAAGPSGDLTTTSAAVVALTGGPSVTLPLEGVYEATISVGMLANQASSGYATAYLYKDAADAGLALVYVFQSATGQQIVPLNEGPVTVTAGQVMTMKVVCANGGSNRFINARIAFRPIRVLM